MNTDAEKLKDKRALVTGATGGIGLAIVETLVNAGVKVIAQGRSSEKLNELSKKHPSIKTEMADLRMVGQVEGLAHMAMEHYGGLDILINNAGMNAGNNVIDLDIATFDEILCVNLRAVFILSKLIGKAMVNQKDGYIINIGSGASTTPIAGMATYCASKHGLLGFSESLALELRSSGVKVSMILPGSTATGFNDFDPDDKISAKPGILMPEDIAETVMYLLNQSKRAWASQVTLRPLDPKQAF